MARVTNLGSQKNDVAFDGNTEVWKKKGKLGGKVMSPVLHMLSSRCL